MPPKVKRAIGDNLKALMSKGGSQKSIADVVDKAGKTSKAGSKLKRFGKGKY